jgi:hypothetical protein
MQREDDDQEDQSDDDDFHDDDMTVLMRVYDTATIISSRTIYVHSVALVGTKAIETSVGYITSAQDGL